MALVKGYYNVNNETFLGPVTAVNAGTGVASTPRYVEGVCFGEYNTDTGEFVPETNPMVIPKGSIVEYDEDVEAFKRGHYKQTVTGMEEDKGADFARKQISVPNPKAKAPKTNKLILPGDKAFDLDNLF